MECCDVTVRVRSLLASPCTFAWCDTTLDRAPLVLLNSVTISEDIHYLADQIKEDEMGGACSTHETDDKCVQTFGWKA
jgi:hypothetical protein